ncbi:MAG: sigma-70 family RNA polymerase sigma factor [Planctomycetota bacterium]|nr:sigma-70 family RNA polymerase sigma factor [Planctomycetota bacterium]
MPDTDSTPAPRQADPTTPAARPDPGAWVADHLDAVYRYARRRLPAEDAEDVAQQSFEALFRAYEKGTVPADAGAYLLGTARRRVADLVRRRARRGEVVGLPEGWAGYVEAALPAETLAAAELKDLVHVALGLLPAGPRSLLLAYYRGGVRVAELAERAGLTPKAVELRLRRARQAFAERFRRVGRDWTDEWDEVPAGNPNPSERGTR